MTFKPLNLTGVSRTVSSLVSPRQLQKLSGKTPDGKVVAVQQRTGETGVAGSPARLFQPQSPAGQRLSANLALVTPRPLGRRHFSTVAGPRPMTGAAEGGVRSETPARRFIEDCCSGKTDGLMSIYPPKEREFVLWFIKNLPVGMPKTIPLEPVRLSEEKIRALEAQVAPMRTPGGDLSPEGKAIVVEAVKAEAAKPENRRLFGLTPEARSLIVGHEELPAEARAHALVLARETKNWLERSGAGAQTSGEREANIVEAACDMAAIAASKNLNAKWLDRITGETTPLGWIGELDEAFAQAGEHYRQCLNGEVIPFEDMYSPEFLSLIDTFNANMPEGLPKIGLKLEYLDYEVNELKHEMETEYFGKEQKAVSPEDALPLIQGFYESVAQGKARSHETYFFGHTCNIISRVTNISPAEKAAGASYVNAMYRKHLKEAFYGVPNADDATGPEFIEQAAQLMAANAVKLFRQGG